jgi:hypothetical protein
LLQLIEMGRLSQDVICSTAAAAAAAGDGPNSSSSSSRSSLQQQWQAAAADHAAVDAAWKLVQAVAAEATYSARSHAEDLLCHLKLQTLLRLPTSPMQFLQHAFTFMGQQQLSPVCLHSGLQQQQQPQQGSDIYAMIGEVLECSPELRTLAIERARKAAADAAGRFSSETGQMAAAGQHWTDNVTKAYSTWQQQRGAGAAGQSSSSSSSNMVSGSDGEAEDPDQLQALVSSCDSWQGFCTLIVRMLSQQEQWVETVGPAVRLAECRDIEVDRVAALKFQQSHNELKASQKEQQEQLGKATKKKQKGAKKSGAGKQKKSGRESGDENDSDAAAADAGSRRGKYGGSKRLGDENIDVSSDDDEGKQKRGEAEELAELARMIEGLRICEMCAAEAAASARLSSSSGIEAGLYVRFPVSCADPCLMRRVVWDLLGRIKPTAQQWFRRFGFMCPHRSNKDKWRDVVVSLARHIWSPAGPWDEGCEAQLALLLPLHVRSTDRVKEQEAAAEAAARARYAHCLSASFALQGADAQAAALLSLHALLAMDPHTARMQPRPELLFYTPAGFHAAVCKTLMQAVEVTSGVPLQSAAAAAYGNTNRSSSIGGWTAGTAAAAGGSACQQQQDQAGGQPKPHHLQAWSAATFPAWYVWWHMGLMAYQQQQQQHAPAAVGGRHISSGSSSDGSSSSSLSLLDLYNSAEAR